MDDLDFLLSVLNANAKVDDDGFYRCIWLMFNNLYFNDHNFLNRAPRQLSIFDFDDFESSYMNYLFEYDRYIYRKSKEVE